jgi:hypothetical protein
MRPPFRKKSRFQRALDPDPAKMSKAIRSTVADRPVKSGLIAAGGVVGLTAGSAVVSSVRRRTRDSSDES